MKTLKLVRIFLATPSDVSPEREVVKTVINEINGTLGAALNFRTEVTGWENVPPARGKSAQKVISSYIGENYDIFLGVMWSRVGTPTDGAESGTIYEYESALKLDDNREDFQLMWFFKDDNIEFSKIDPIQLSKVKSFRETVANDGCYYDVFKSSDFEKKLRMHLSSTIPKLLKKETAELAKAKLDTSQPTIKKTSNTDIDGAGLLDYRVDLDDASNKFGRLLMELSSGLELVNEANNNATSKLNTINGSPNSPDPKEIMLILEEPSEALNLYSIEVEEIIPDLEIEFNKMITAATGIQIFNLNNTTDNNNNEEENKIAIHGLIKDITEAKDNLASFRKILKKTLPLTRNYRNARDKTVSSLKHQEKFLNSCSTQLRTL